MKRETKKVSSLYVILGCLFVTCLLISNIIAGKLISVFGMVLPAAVILFPVAYIFGDILTEVYGFKRSRLIIWTGLTLKYLYKHLRARKPASLKVCTLLDKPERRKVELTPDYNGFQIPDHFVVGYGLDCGQRYRNLRDINIIHQECDAGSQTEEECIRG
jgi:hypothetical protein